MPLVELMSQIQTLPKVEAMYKQKLFSLNNLRNCFEAITPELIRFPSLNPDILKSRIEKFIERCENNLEENQP
jgi:hypothetical protein